MTNGYSNAISIEGPPPGNVPICDVAGTDVVRNIVVRCSGAPVVEVWAIIYTGLCVNVPGEGPGDAGATGATPDPGNTGNPGDPEYFNVASLEGEHDDLCLKVWVLFEGDEEYKTAKLSLFGVPAGEGDCEGSGSGSGGGWGGLDDPLDDEFDPDAQTDPEIEAASMGHAPVERAETGQRRGGGRGEGGGERSAGNKRNGGGAATARAHGPAQSSFPPWLVITKGAPLKYQIRFSSATLGLDPPSQAFFQGGALQLMPVVLSFDPRLSTPDEAVWKSGNCCAGGGTWILRVIRFSSNLTADLTLHRASPHAVLSPYAWESNRFAFYSTTPMTALPGLSDPVPTVWIAPA